MRPDSLPKVFASYFFARQPIFDRQGAVWGYELLFRDGPGQDKAQIRCEDLATICVATCAFTTDSIGTDLNKKLCINFTENLIRNGGPRGLPPAVTVIELLETIPPTPEVIAAIIELKQEGYLFALDDYEGDPVHKPLLELSDIVKVDILGKSFAEIDRIYATLQGFRGPKIAEKVDNQETLRHLQQLGFDLYQGYYFARPEILSGRKLESTALSKLRILQQVEDVNATTDDIVEVIAADPSITYRLLRLLNTVGFGLSVKVSSVRHAAMLLGNRRLKYWLRMVILSDLASASHKTPELYAMALTRGRFFEELALGQPIHGVGPETLFLFGLLSLIDAMLDSPMAEILSALPIPEEVKQGYVDAASPFARYLRLVVSLEGGDAQSVQTLCQELKLREKKVAEASVHAVAWANSICSQVL